jgi:predicted dehydrogenase
MSEKYRAGIIGCGWVSTGHMNGYLATGRIEIVSAADISKKQLKLFGAEWKVKKAYTDYREMLSKEKLDIVSICTWPVLHSKMTIESSRYGLKAIVCEKPIALSLRESDKMIAACEKSGSQLIVSHQRRFERRYVKAKELIEKGTIGRIISLGTFSGDLFVDGTHVIDLMRFLVNDRPAKFVMGQIDWGKSRHYAFGHTREECALGYIIFQDGIYGIIRTARLVQLHPETETKGYSFHIVGTEGIMEISGGNYPVAHWVKVKGKYGEWKKYLLSDDLIGEPKEKIMGQDTIDYYWVGSWKRQMEALIVSLEENKEHPCSGQSARADLEIIIGIFQSAKSGKLLEFPIKVFTSPVSKVKSTSKWGR